MIIFWPFYFELILNLPSNHPPHQLEHRSSKNLLLSPKLIKKTVLNWIEKCKSKKTRNVLGKVSNIK